jgi:hypothetical protein
MRFSRSAFAALSLALLPFVVAFDYPDTTGVRAKVSAGRGTYSLSTCSRRFQSEYVEENVALRATFATGSEGTTWGKRLRPGKTTVRADGGSPPGSRIFFCQCRAVLHHSGPIGGEGAWPEA